MSQTTHISEADMDNAHNEHAEDQVGSARAQRDLRKLVPADRPMRKSCKHDLPDTLLLEATLPQSNETAGLPALVDEEQDGQPRNCRKNDMT